MREYVYGGYVDENFVKGLDYDAVVLAHTHVPFVKRIKDKLVINTGSIGQSRDRDPRASFAIVDLEKFDAEIIRVKYDIKTAAEKIIKAGLPEFLATRLYSGI